MLRTPRRRALAALAVPLMLLFPAAASAAAGPVAGTVSDRGDDAKNGAQDIVSAGVGYSPSGVVDGGIKTAAPAFDPFVSLVEASLGTASKRQGLCRLAFDVDLYPAKPASPGDLFGVLWLGAHKLRFQAASQQGGVLGFDTLDGDDIGTSQGPMPAISKRRWNCALVRTFGPKAHKGNYRTDDATRVFPLLPGSAPTPDCRVPTRKAHRGRRIRVTCRHAGRRVTVRFHRHQHLKGTRHARLHHGHARVSTRGLHRGWNDISLWARGAMVGNGSVRIR